LAEGLKKANGASWDNIVGQMRRLITDAIEDAKPETLEIAARPARLTELAVQ
jgi:hypothetical protein